jgi:phenylacetate-CoA ligase
MVVPDPESRGPYHRYNVFERQVYFSAFHLSPASVATYVAALRRHRPTWLTGYANSWYTLARLAKEAGLDCPSPRAVITTSEKVTPHMRSVMEDFFGCKVYEEYGTVEDVAYASECERGGLHVSPDAGIVEIVDAAGKPVGPGEFGRVVATGFVRHHQLFVRFALGDEAAWSDATCPCGREMPLLQEIRGRIEDAVVGPDGREMVRFHGIFVDQPHIAEGQIVQEALHEITVNVVPTSGFASADVEEIRRRVQARLTPDVTINVRTVASIPRTAAGKFQAVVSRVSPSAVLARTND